MRPSATITAESMANYCLDWNNLAQPCFPSCTLGETERTVTELGAEAMAQPELREIAPNVFGYIQPDGAWGL